MLQKHEFVGYKQYIPGEPDEWISYCKLCGAENMGEFNTSEFCPEEEE